MSFWKARALRALGSRLEMPHFPIGLHLDRMLKTLSSCFSLQESGLHQPGGDSPDHLVKILWPGEVVAGAGYDLYFLF